MYLFTHATLQLLACAIVMPKLDVKINLKDDRAFLLRGENIGLLSVVTSIKNIGKTDALITDFDLAKTKGDFRINIYTPSGVPMQERSGPPFLTDRDWHIVIGPQEERETKNELSGMGYSYVKECGDYLLVGVFRPRPRSLTYRTKPIKMKVIDVKPANIVEERMIIGHTPNRLSGDQVVLIQQIQVENSVYLYFRAANRKNGVITEPYNTVHLAILKKKTDMLVAGTVGSRNNIRIAFRKPESQTGIVLLTVNSVDGALVRKDEYDDKTQLDQINK